MEENGNANGFAIGPPGVLSWIGLAIIGVTLFFCGANEWSVLPVFSGAWILWRGTNSNGLAIITSIALAILLTRFGVRLEGSFGYVSGSELFHDSIILAHESFDSITVIISSVSLCFGYWIFCAGIQMSLNQINDSKNVCVNKTFYSSGKWISWFWVFCIVGLVAFGVYEIFLRQPDDFFAMVGWKWSMRLARFLSLAWLLGAGVVLFRFWSKSPVGKNRCEIKSLIWLQDILWRETRREQSRAQQWIVHAVQEKRKLR